MARGMSGGQTIGKLGYQISSSFDGRGFDTAERRVGRWGGAADSSLGKAEGRIAKRIGSIGKIIAFGAAGAAVALGAIGKKAIDAASDMQESLSKVTVVFDKNAGQIVAWSKTAATSLGISQQEALEAAGTFGNFFRAMGVGMKPATDMSKGIVQLASDLASFNNANPEDVLLALRSGLAGEAEPLRRFGVNLNAARIEEEALRLGLIKQGQELTGAAKAQAAYSIIMKDTTLAQGDFARTSGGVANQTRIMKARMKDLTAQIGAKLLPIATKLLTWGNKFFDALGSPEVARAAKQIGTVLVGAFGRLKQIIATVVSAVRTAVSFLVQAFAPVVNAVRANMETIKGVFTSAWAAVKAIFTVAIGAIVLAWKLFGDDLINHLKRIVGPIAQVFKAAFDVVAGVFEFFIAVFTGKWGAAWDAIKKVFSGIWNGIVGVVRIALSGIRAAFDMIVSPIRAAWSALWGGLKGVVTGIGKAIVTVFARIINAVIHAINAAIRAYNKLPFHKDVKTIETIDPNKLFAEPAASSSAPAGTTVNAGKTASFDKGGVVGGRRGMPQLVVAHGGETITPPGESVGDAGGGAIKLQLFLDGRDITNTVRARMVKVAKRAPSVGLA